MSHRMATIIVLAFMAGVAVASGKFILADGGGVLTKVMAPLEVSLVVREVEPIVDLVVSDLDGNLLNEVTVEYGFYTDPQPMAMVLVSPSQVRLTNSHHRPVSLRTPCKLPIKIGPSGHLTVGGSETTQNKGLPKEQILGYLFVQEVGTFRPPICKPDPHDGIVRTSINFTVDEIKTLSLSMELVDPPPVGKLPKDLTLQIKGIFTGFEVPPSQ